VSAEITIAELQLCIIRGFLGCVPLNARNARGIISSLLFIKY